MSELYEHLKKLEEKERRIRDEGMPAPVPMLGRQKPAQSRVSRRWLVGIPAAFMVLGFVTVFAVMELKKKTPPPIPSSQTVASKSHAPQNIGRESDNTSIPGPLVLLEKQRGEKTGTAGVSTAFDGGIGPSTPREETSIISDMAKSMEAKGETTDSSAQPPAQPSADAGAASRGGNEKEHRVQPIVSSSSEDSSDKENVIRIEEKPRTRKTASAKTAVPGPAPAKEPPPESSRQVLVVAEEARQRGDWEEAERGYREYLAIQKDPSVMNNLGAVLIARGLYGEAEQVLSRAYAQSSDPEIAANLCISLWAQGKKDHACRLVVSLSESSSISRPAPAVQRLLHYCRPER